MKQTDPAASVTNSNPAGASPLQLLQTLLPPGDAAPQARDESPALERRKDARLHTWIPARWDFFTLQTGSRLDGVSNLSRSGCLLVSNEPIELRRWVRIAIQLNEIPLASKDSTGDRLSTLTFTLVGRVVRKRKIERESPLFYGSWEHGIQFLQPLNGAFEKLLESALEKQNRHVPVQSLN